MKKGAVNEDFIQNPTNLSKKILELAHNAQEQYSHLQNPAKFKDKVKLRLLYLRKYVEICTFTKDVEKKEISNDVKTLIEDLQTVFNHISLNNILLHYSFVVDKEKKNPILTKEDEKLLMLKKFYLDEIALKDFVQKFGHYALNPFELSSKRFREYSNKDMKKIGKLLREFKVKKQYTLDEYMKKSKKNLFTVYSTLREELKYCALRYIAALRSALIKIGEENNIKNIFDLEYGELQRKGYC